MSKKGSAYGGEEINMLYMYTSKNWALDSKGKDYMI